jgi:transcription termination factor NusB
MNKTEEWLYKKAKEVDSEIELQDLYTSKFTFSGRWVMDLLEEYHKEQLLFKTVFVVTERDNYGEQVFRGVFTNREKAIKFLSKDGLTESNIDEINEIDI